MSKTRYTVTGPYAFGDHQPGDVFEEELDPELEARAIERGSITKTADVKKEAKTDG